MTNTFNPQNNLQLPIVETPDVTYEEMYEFLEKVENQNPRIVRALMQEIGYGSDPEVIYDDSDTVEQDLYLR